MASEESKDWYRFTGMKNASDETSVLILEGSSTNPVVAIEKGKEVELTEAQVEAAKGMGARINAVSDERVAKIEEQQKEAEEAAAPRGSEQKATAQSGSTPAGQSSTKSKS